jgi:gliding motility-associated-like protein
MRITSILLLAFLLLIEGGSLNAQWLNGYSHRVIFSMDESLNMGSIPLTDFPILFSYSDTLIRSASYGGYVQFADGTDFCFTDQDSITVLDFEIESYDPESGSLSAWVRIPSLSAVSGTDLYLYYGNPDALALWDREGVWSNQYTAVWHMADDPSGSEPQISDATSLMNHGTTGGQMTADDLVDGKVSLAIQFDGVDDYVSMPVSGFNTDAGTAELWIKLDSLPESNSNYLFAHRKEDPISDRTYLRVWSSGEWGTGMGDTYDLVRGQTLDTVSWHHLAITWNGTDVTGFLDGAQDFGPVAYASLDTVREIYVMTWMPSSESASGTLDELRVSGIERDSVWLAASYLIQHQPKAYYQTQTQFINDIPCSGLLLDMGDTCAFSIFSNIGAEDSGIPDPSCGNYAGGDIWFYLVVPESGSFSIQTDTETEEQYPNNNGWMYRAALALYTGSCNSLVQLGCYENNSIYHPRMAGAEITGQIPGDTIWVRIWENTNNDVGKLKICVCSGEQCMCPAIFLVEGGGGYCEGETGVEIRLSGSQSTYMYTLVRNDSIELDTLQGTGDSLAWSAVTEPGLYTVMAHHPSHSCSQQMSQSAEVIRYDVPQLAFQATDITCFEMNDGSIVSTITGGAEPYLTIWTGPGGFSSSERDLYDLAPGSYALSVTDDHQCMNSGPGILISQPDLLVASLEQFSHLTSYEANDGSIQVSAAGGTPPYEFSWTGTNHHESMEQNPTDLSVGNYDLRVTDAHLCQDSILEITLTIDQASPAVFIPEGFSPNGDGYNDYFVIIGIEDYPGTELLIMNRQGVTVYHSTDYQNDWDGNADMGGVMGSILSEGTYYYVLKFSEGNVKKGFLYLNRE